MPLLRLLLGLARESHSSPLCLSTFDPTSLLLSLSTQQPLSLPVSLSSLARSYLVLPWDHLFLHLPGPCLSVSPTGLLAVRECVEPALILGSVHPCPQQSWNLIPYVLQTSAQIPPSEFHMAAAYQLSAGRAKEPGIQA